VCLCLIARTLAAVAAQPSQPATQTILPEPATSQPIAATAPAPIAPAATTAPATQPDDDFAPGLAIFALIVLLVLLFFALIALILAAIVGIALLILLLIGILSLSVLFGVLKRSVSAAAKALTIQLLALCGIPVGIALIWVLSHLLHRPIPAVATIFLGILCGAGSGAAVGYLLTKALSLLTAAIAKRLTSKTKPVTAHFPVSPQVVDVSPLPPGEHPAN